MLRATETDLPSILPYILELLSVKESGISADLTPEERKACLMDALKAITIRGAEIRPTILIIEDLHWIDKTSEEVIKYIFENIAGSKILLIFTFRPEFIHTWGAKTYHNQVTLSKLSNRESLEMISDLMELKEIDPVLEELILDKTEGVPFFIEELINSLKDLKLIEEKDNRYQLAKHFQDVSIPSSIHDVIMARVDALPEKAKEVIQTGSAIEREFSYELLKNILDITQEELLSNLSILKDLELIYERGIFPQSSYIFKHALTQEVIYESILKNKTKTLHEKIGNGIEHLYSFRLEEFYEALAYHYLKSNKLEKAYKFLKLSGEKALKNFANDEAYNFLLKAIEILNRMPDTGDNQKAMMEVSLLIYNPSLLIGFPEGLLEILQNGQRLSEELGDKRSLINFYGHISRYYGYQGKPLEGIAYIEPRFYEARKNRDVELMASLAPNLFTLYHGSGNYEKTVDIADVISLLEKDGIEYESFGLPFNEYSYLCTYYGFSLAFMGKFKEGKIFFEKGLNFAVKINNIINLSLTEGFYGTYYYLKGDGNKVIEHSQKSVNYCEKVNFIWYLGIAWTTLGTGYYYINDLDAAKDCIEKGYSIHKNTSVLRFRSLHLYYLSFVYHDMGEFSKATSCLEEALKLSMKFNERAIEANTRCLLGRLMGKTSNPKKIEAEKFILHGIEMSEKLKLGPETAQAYFFLGELYANTGRKDEALENLNKALSMCQEMGIGYWPDKIQEVLVQL